MPSTAMNEPIDNSKKMAPAFGKNARLTNHSQLEEVKQNGIRKNGHYSIVIIKKAPADDTRRAAFLISRRFDLLAVVRNRARRLYREAFRQLVAEIPPAWILFIPKRNIKGKNLSDVMPELRSMLQEVLEDNSGARQ